MSLHEDLRWLVYCEFLAGRCFKSSSRPRGAELAELLRQTLRLKLEQIEDGVAAVASPEETPDGPVHEDVPGEWAA